MSDSRELMRASDHESEEADTPLSAASFPIVAIGASAGGLEAFTEVLNALPVDTGMAFVLVQHLDPAHESQLSQILSRATAMPVHLITDGMAVEPNLVYVIPPNTLLTTKAGRLRIAPRPQGVAAHQPINAFFKSLATQQGRLSIGVILSGNGTDGTEGLKAIKGQCGMTFVQSEATAKFDGMPRSAILSGAANFILSPGEIAKELARISNHPFVLASTENAALEVLPEGESELRSIFALVQQVTGVDFSHYKQATTRRRIGRRMIVHRSRTLAEYLAYLEQHPEEVQELHQDILISVTLFFRDPDSFAALAEKLRPAIRGRNPRETFRVWVPGCATGEEVYSLGICLQELFMQEGVAPVLQLFGTDISEVALIKARAGRYPESIVPDISPERLRGYFHKTDGQYQITKRIRDCCVFAKQDLTRDPPFSRVDLVSCRNTLIYLDQTLQKTVMQTFHYSLNEGGLLFLAPAESISTATDLFDLLDRKHKIHVRKVANGRSTLASPFPRTSPGALPATSRSAALTSDWQKQADQLIQNRYAPDGIIVDQNLTILQTRGRTRNYLQPAAPGIGRNLLMLARSDLQLPLRETVAAAMTRNAPAQRKGLHLSHGGEEREVNLEVIPLSAATAGDRFYFVIFEQINPKPLAQEDTALLTPSPPKTPEEENLQLKQQLGELHEYFHALSQEHLTALEEQRASNEEISSSNEELQSTNEELSTAKEELQSTNEELTTVNEELQNRNNDLSILLNDLNNLFAVVNTPILLFDRNLLLRRFTPAAEKHLGLTPLDLQRSISGLPARTRVPPLEALVQDVIENLSVHTHEMQDGDGFWWSVTLRPYRTLDHRIDGAVLTFADVNSLKNSLQGTEESRDYAEGIVETIREPLLVLSPDLTIERANTSFYRTFQMEKEDTEGKLIYELDAGEWNIPDLRHLLEGILPHVSSFEDFSFEHHFPRLGWRSLSLNARGICRQDRSLDRILLAVEDITERKLAEKQLLASYSDMKQFGYAVAHDLQEPLRAITNSSERILGRLPGELNDDSRSTLNSLMLGVRRLDAMVQDMLLYSQAGAGDASLEPVSVKAALNEALWNLEVSIRETSASITYGDLPSIHCNARSLIQVLQNIIGNALKYRGLEPPQIRIEAVQEAHEWIFSIRDNGIGFDQQYAETIFGVFKRLNFGKSKGTGIGLAICKRAIERGGGKIWAKSQPGAGSTFYFSVPTPAAIAALQTATHA